MYSTQLLVILLPLDDENDDNDDYTPYCLPFIILYFNVYAIKYHCSAGEWAENKGAPDEQQRSGLMIYSEISFSLQVTYSSM